MQIVSVVGARPQFVKLAAVCRAIPQGVDHRIVHTGQHYDSNMSDLFFSQLEIESPITNLRSGSGNHGAQTAAMLAGIEEYLLENSPDWVLVIGDTNSTIAGALAAVKLHLRVAHLEAGLRSFNRRMPEEINRILTDHASDLLLAPSELATRNLVREGLEDRVALVGDVMVDVLLEEKKRILQNPPSLPNHIGSSPFIVATLHRQELLQDIGRLGQVIERLRDSTDPVYLVAHPRLRKVLEGNDLEPNQGSLQVTEPLGYQEMLRLLMESSALVTDSGGMQKEAFLLGTPTATIRPETEWPETVETGWNRLIWDDWDQLSDFISSPLAGAAGVNPYGSGDAAQRSIDAMIAASN